MLFAAQIYVATTAEHVQSQRRKNNEPNNQFPHVWLQINQVKKAPAERQEPFRKSLDLGLTNPENQLHQS